MSVKKYFQYDRINQVLTQNENVCDIVDEYTCVFYPNHNWCILNVEKMPKELCFVNTLD